MVTPEERLTRLEAEHQHLAFKEDIARLEGAMKEDVTRLEGAMKEDIARLEGAFKEDITRLEGIIKEAIAQTHTAIAQSEARQIRWIIGLMVGSIAVATAIAVFIQRLIGG